MAKRSLRVLITNHQLGDPGGSEVNVRDLALGLLRRGHRPVVYSPVLGQTANALRERTVPVVDDLSLIAEPPDVIHASHTPTVIEAAVRFPRTPAIQVVQSTGYPGVGYPMSEPLFLKQVRRFIAVDENTREYLVGASGVAPNKICLVRNAVDLTRIPERTRPLPPRPRNALIFTKTESQVPIIMEACGRAGIEVSTLGRGVGRVVARPEHELVLYDLVFATARSALEAIAAGAATVVVDGRGLAGMATRQNAAWLRQHNFGARSLLREVTRESIRHEIAQYDPVEAAALTASLRPEIDIEPQLDSFERIYDEVIAEHAASPASTDDLVIALGPILHRWLPRFPGTDWPWQFQQAALTEHIAQLDAALARERAERIQAERGIHERYQKVLAAGGGVEAFLKQRRLEPPFAPEQGLAWQFVLPPDPLLDPLRRLADNLGLQQSPLRLLENGVPLGPSHAPHDLIRQQGGGSYSHWFDNLLLFSTSDNSDPNSNGREYRIEWIMVE